MFLIHPLKNKIKPDGFKVAQIQKTWNEAINSSNIDELKTAIENGQTIKFNEGTLNTIIIDADNVSKSLKNCLSILKLNNLVPSLAYESFSASDIKNNFRLIYFLNDDQNLNKNLYINFTLKLEEILGINLDFAFANNSKQICYGTNKKCYQFEQSEIELDQSANTSELLSLRFKNKSNGNKCNVDVVYLENLSYDQFNNKLLDILKTKNHISYDLAIRWFFANSFKPKLRDEILSLGSIDTQQKITDIWNKHGNKYALKLFEPNGNFQKLFLNQKKKFLEYQHNKKLNKENENVIC